VFESFNGDCESCQIRFFDFLAKWQLKIVTVSLLLIIQPTAASEDERQFVRHGGQEWTTLKRLAAYHHNRLEEEAPRLLGIGTEPEFAIGQRALFLQSDGGNLLWVASRFSTARPLPSFTRAAVSAPSRSHIRIITRRWWNGRSDSIRKCFCTMPIASG
jgi:hypothetical protein